MTRLTDAEKIFDEIQHPVMTKRGKKTDLEKAENEGQLLRSDNKH